MDTENKSQLGFGGGGPFKLNSSRTQLNASSVRQIDEKKGTLNGNQLLCLKKIRITEEVA
jgi:hypothetical protein